MEYINLVIDKEFQYQKLNYSAVILRARIFRLRGCQLFIMLVFPPLQWYNKKGTNYHLLIPIIMRIC